jgi:hypothetical protein
MWNKYRYVLGFGLIRMVQDSPSTPGPNCTLTESNWISFWFSFLLNLIEFSEHRAKY